MSIKDLQRQLGVTEDGIAGPNTANAMREMLAKQGVSADVVGERTQMSATIYGATSSMERAAELPANVDGDWMAIARGYIGLHETTNNAELVELLREGRFLGDPDRLAWCGDFVESCLFAAGVPVPLGTPFWARSWLNFSAPIKPRFGAIMVFRRGRGGHVGFYVGEDGGAFHILGGNQNDQVSVARINRLAFLGARWPRGVPFDAVAPFELVPKGVAASLA